MGGKQWFEGMRPDEIDGKHVQIRMKDSSMIEGRLTDECSVVTIGSGAGRKIVFERDGTVVDPYVMSDDIDSISLIWDERDWEPVDLSEADDGDSIVVNGELYPITEARFVDGQLMPSWWSVEDGKYIVSPDVVSYALRRKEQLPTEPGMYRSDDGTQIIYLLKDRDGQKWVSIPTDAESTQVDYLTSSQVENYMPLTPVHFVDGRDK